MDKHWHWDFVAFDGEPDASNMIRWGVTITVIGYQSEADALIAAQDIVTREHYKLTRCFECNTCRFQSQAAGSLRELVKGME